MEKKFLMACAAVAALAASVGASAEVGSDVMAVIDGASLNNNQHNAVKQYAESLDRIKNMDLNNQENVISVNKAFMRSQQCLAEIYTVDQKPHMMQVSREVYNKTFNSDDGIKKYRMFLGQALKEGERALPDSASACEFRKN